jgi:putative transposase
MKTLPNLKIAKKMTKQAIEIYNNKRLHWSLDLQTPQSVHDHYTTNKNIKAMRKLPHD